MLFKKQRKYSTPKHLQQNLKTREEIDIGK